MKQQFSQRQVELIKVLGELITQVKPLTTKEIVKFETNQFDKLYGHRVVTNNTIAGVKRTLNALQNKGVVILEGIQITLTQEGEQIVQHYHKLVNKSVDTNKELTPKQKEMLTHINNMLNSNKEVNQITLHSYIGEVEHKNDPHFNVKYYCNSTKFANEEKVLKNLLKLEYIEFVDKTFTSFAQLKGSKAKLQLTQKGKEYLG